MCHKIWCDENLSFFGFWNKACTCRIGVMPLSNSPHTSVLLYYTCKCHPYKNIQLILSSWTHFAFLPHAQRRRTEPTPPTRWERLRGATRVLLPVAAAGARNQTISCRLDPRSHEASLYLHLLADDGNGEEVALARRRRARRRVRGRRCCRRRRHGDGRT